jgi:pyruvate-formate lyase-activating enzyme
MLHVIHEIERQIFVRSSTREILRLLDDARETVRGSLRDQMGEPAAAALTLKLLNLLLARHHFQARSTTVHSRPYGLLVDPSNGCNLACPGCVQSAGAKSLRIFDWHNGLIDERRFATLLERFGPCTLQIMFCNYGEPLTNSNTPRLIEMAKGYLIRTVLSTNLAVPKFDAEAYIRSGLDFMFLAIDGATQPTYSRYRKNGQLAVVFRNIEALVKAKRRLGSPTPTLRWQFLAFEHNRHEIPEALEVARAFGLDQFAVETPFDVSWDDPEVRSARDVRPFQEVFQQAAPGEHRMAPEAAALIERELDRGWVTRAPAAAYQFVRFIPARGSIAA